MNLDDLNAGIDISNPWKLVKHPKRPKFDSGHGLKVYKDKVIDPHGKKTTYSYIVKPEFISVVIVNQDLETYLIGQYRYPLKEFTWEVIKGSVDEGEALENAAKRETEEETGLKISSLELLQGNAILGASKTYRGNIFLVRGIDGKGEQHFDSSEIIFVKKIPLKDAVDMVFRGEIHDSFSCLSILQAAKKVGIISL